VPVTATAYPHRRAEFLMNLHTQWEDADRDGACTSWARDFHESMVPHATGGVYADFVPEEVGDQQAAYRENDDRSVEVKNEWDPENVFRLNHDVEPHKITSHEINQLKLSSCTERLYPARRVRYDGIPPR